MTHFIAVSAAALFLAASSVSFAQTGGSASGGGASSSGGAASSGGAGTPSGLSSTTTAPPVQPVPRPATDPNNQVAPSAVGLPGGGSNVPLSSGSGIGTAVPTFGTQDATRSSGSGSCTGAGEGSNSGAGSASSLASNCRRDSGLGTAPITGNGGAIDVTGR